MKFLELVTMWRETRQNCVITKKTRLPFLGSPDRELKTSSGSVGFGGAMFACCGCTAGEPELAGPAPTKATEADEEERISPR